MPLITKITYFSGQDANFKAFEGLYVPDIDHFKIDMMRYLVGRRHKSEITIESKEMSVAGSWEHQDEVENF